MTKTLMASVPSRSKLGLREVHAALLQERGKQSLIDWPTEAEVQTVSRQLAQIKRMGIRSEADGDYFKSGDLAYQMHEVIRATAVLFRRSRRAKG